MKAKLILSLLIAGSLLGLGGVARAAEPEGRPEWRKFIVRGRVAAIEGMTLRVETPGGEREVTIDEQTCFWKPEVESPTLPDIGVGDRILALGYPDGEDVLMARLVAVAFEGQLRRNITLGRVKAIEGMALTLRTPQGERSMAIDEATCFWRPGVESPTLADFGAGEFVIVLGHSGEEGRLKAVAVALVPPPVLRRHGVHGLVKAIEGKTLVVETRDGEGKVLTDAETQFRVPGVESPTIDDVKVGDHVIVWGRPDEEGWFVAKGVAVKPGRRLRQHVLRGEVTTIEGMTLMMETPGGERKVITDGDTVFRAPSLDDVGLVDIQPGEEILALGDPGGRGDLLAKVVGLVPIDEDVRQHILRGQVRAIGDGLSIETPEGEQRVATDVRTYFRVPGVEEATIEDIKAGSRGLVLTYPASDGTPTAWVVVVVGCGSPLPGNTLFLPN